MRSNDLPEFTRQVEVLCAGFNIPPTDLRVEALWRSLQSMDLMVFTRVVEFALTGGGGTEKMPTAPQIWNLSRQMKARAPVREQPRDTGAQYDHFHGFGQRALMAFLKSHGPASTDSLQRLVAAKNRIVAEFRMISGEDAVTADELREALFRAFERDWSTASFDESETWREKICREHSLHFVPRESPAA